MRLKATSNKYSKISITVRIYSKTWKSFCYSYRSQLQIQSRYAPDTVAIMSLIHSLSPSHSCSIHRCFSVTQIQYRYTPDTVVILIFIPPSNTFTARIRPRYGGHFFFSYKLSLQIQFKCIPDTDTILILILLTSHTTVQQTFPMESLSPSPNGISKPISSKILSSPNGICKPIPSTYILTSANLRAL